MKCTFNGKRLRISGVGYLFIISLLLCGCNQSSSPTSGNLSDLSDPTIKPVVISTLPSNNGVGPFEVYNPGEGVSMPSFIVQFNKLMIVGSFKPGSITCKGFDRPVAVYLHNTIDFLRKQGKQGSRNKSALYSRAGDQASSDYEDVLEFDVRDSIAGLMMRYKVGQKYTVTIHSSLEDINSNYLKTPYSFSFTPEPNFRIILFYPADDQKVGTSVQEIEVMFNSPVSPGSFSQIQITPGIAGPWTISPPDSIYAYLPISEPLKFNTVYSIRVPSLMSDKYGNHLKNDFTSTFTTASFSVSFASPSNGSTNVTPATSLRFSFSGQLDPSTVQPAFTISPNVTGTISVSGSDFSFTPTEGLAFNTAYTVTLSTALKAADGTSLPSPYTETFSTGSFQITGTYPSDGTTNWPPTNSITVSFNNNIDTSSINSAFSISPEVAGYFGNDYSASYGFSFIPYTGFKSNTTYTVLISTALKSSNGTNLPAPYSFSFSTAPFQVLSIFPSVYVPNGRIGRTSYFEVSCNAVIDTSTPRSAFSITPDVSGAFHLYPGKSYFLFYPDSQLVPSTSYTVEISKSLKAADGTTLSQDYYSTFLTGQY
jgi:hypothetical protein